MKRVIILSPYAGDVATHREYLERCIRDCAMRGEAPYASHKMMTDALDDSDDAERELGIACEWSWMQVADLAVAFRDYGVTRGMAAGMLDAGRSGVPLEDRWIGKNP